MKHSSEVDIPVLSPVPDGTEDEVKGQFSQNVQLEAEAVSLARQKRAELNRSVQEARKQAEPVLAKVNLFSNGTDEEKADDAVSTLKIEDYEALDLYRNIARKEMALSMVDDEKSESARQAVSAYEQQKEYIEQFSDEERKLVYRLYLQKLKARESGFSVNPVVSLDELNRFFGIKKKDDGTEGPVAGYVARGIVQAAAGVADAMIEISQTGEMLMNVVTPDVVAEWLGPEVAVMKEWREKELLAVDKERAEKETIVERPDTATEGIIRSATQFFAPFAAAAKSMAGIKWASGFQKMAAYEAVAGLVGFAAFDAADGNLHSFLREIGVDNAYTRALSSDLASNQIEGKALTLLEDTLLAAGIGFVFSGGKWVIAKGASEDGSRRLARSIHYAGVMMNRARESVAKAFKQKAESLMRFQSVEEQDMLQAAEFSREKQQQSKEVKNDEETQKQEPSQEPEAKKKVRKKKRRKEISEEEEQALSEYALGMIIEGKDKKQFFKLIEQKTNIDRTVADRVWSFALDMSERGGAPPEFYSSLERSIIENMPPQMRVSDLRESYKKWGGIKQNEVEWSPFKRLLDLPGDTVIQKGDVLKTIRNGSVKVIKRIRASGANVFPDDPSDIPWENDVERWSEVVRLRLEDSYVLDEALSRETAEIFDIGKSIESEVFDPDEEELLGLLDRLEENHVDATSLRKMIRETDEGIEVEDADAFINELDMLINKRTDEIRDNLIERFADNVEPYDLGVYYPQTARVNGIDIKMDEDGYFQAVHSATGEEISYTSDWETLNSDVSEWINSRRPDLVFAGEDPEVQYMDFVSDAPGDLKEYVELTLQWDSRLFRYNAPHFPSNSTNLIAHARGSVREINGENVFVIDELQSDWDASIQFHGTADEMDKIRDQITRKLDKVVERRDRIAEQIKRDVSAIVSRFNNLEEFQSFVSQKLSKAFKRIGPVSDQDYLVGQALTAKTKTERLASAFFTGDPERIKNELTFSINRRDVGPAMKPFISEVFGDDLARKLFEYADTYDRANSLHREIAMVPVGTNRMPWEGGAALFAMRAIVREAASRGMNKIMLQSPQGQMDISGTDALAIFKADESKVVVKYDPYNAVEGFDDLDEIREEMISRMSNVNGMINLVTSDPTKNRERFIDEVSSAIERGMLGKKRARRYAERLADAYEERLETAIVPRAEGFFYLYGKKFPSELKKFMKSFDKRIEVNEIEVAGRDYIQIVIPEDVRKKVAGPTRLFNFLGPAAMGAAVMQEQSDGARQE